MKCEVCLKDMGALHKHQDMCPEEGCGLHYVDVQVEKGNVDTGLHEEIFYRCPAGHCWKEYGGED